MTVPEIEQTGPLLAENRRCSVADCTAPMLCRGWCNKHYQRWRKHGDPTKTLSAMDTRDPRFLRSLEDRFWEKVQKTDTCWLWAGAINGTGYGAIAAEGGRAAGLLPAHRVSYELHKGSIPPGLQVDHLCFVRHCVNPAHLEAVTQQVNIERENARRWAQ